MIIIMKAKIIKRIAGISAIGIAGMIAVGTILNTILPVHAEDTLFGIETLMQEVQKRETPYRILEIVPDERAAEIGYYIPGYEPILSERQAGTGLWSDWTEGLKQYATSEARSRYMEKLNAQLQEFYAIRGVEPGNQPVTYGGYAESEEAEEGYTELSFDEEIRKGYFIPYSGTADVERYELDFRYVGNYNESDVTGNITTQYYYVQSAVKITSDMLDDLTDEAVLYQFISQTGAERFEKAGTWGELRDTLEGYFNSRATVSGGNGTVTGGNLSGGDTDYYLLRIEPWEQAIVPAYWALYTVESITGSDRGAYEFTLDSENGFEYVFDRASIYYRGGFENSEWFHTKVLNMQPHTTENFPIEVITLTVSELNALTELPAYDLLYLNSGMQSFADSEEMLSYSVANDVSEEMRMNLFGDAVVNAKPCVVDAGLIYVRNTQGEIEVNSGMVDTNMLRLAAMFLQKSPMAYYNDIILNRVEEPSVVELLADTVDDADKNFVVEQVYSFFAPMKLIGSDFGVYSIYKGGQSVNGTEEGFETVLDEILSENLNREADSSGAYALLSTDVSQATAVRHVMNYRNRRQIKVKESIRVLELQPAKSDAASYDLTEEEIKSWAPDVKTVQIDRMTTAEFIGKIDDINETYDLVYIGTDRDSMNVVSGTERVRTTNIEVKNGNFENGTGDWTVWGSAQASRAGYSGRGIQLNGATVVQYVKVEEGATYTLSAWGRVAGDNKRGTLGVDFSSSNSDAGKLVGSAAEMAFTSTSYTKNSITFTTLEGTRYIMIYLWSGAASTYFDEITLQKVEAENDTVTAGSTVFNDSTMDGLIYFHTGDLRYSAMELAGMLDTEYIGGDRSNHVYYFNPVRYGGNDITEEKRDALLSFLDASYPIIVSDEVFESPLTVFQHIGWGGYSVNLETGRYNQSALNTYGIKERDITSLKVSEGYRVKLYREDNFRGEPLVLTEDSFYLGNDWNDKAMSIEVEAIENQETLRTRKIDEDHIDNSSFMYEFIAEAMKKTNFYARSEMGQDSGRFKFYLNRPKVNVTKVSANGKNPADGVIDINPGADGRYMLQYKFTIQNDGAASADTLYECKLYVDVNADGKYSSGEELKDITLTQNGKAVSSTNLYAGREYELSRYVPDGYKGVMPWKIEISQINNEHIHNGVTGYTKLQGLSAETLKILQVCRDQITKVDWWGGSSEVLFNLQRRIADETDIYHVLIYGGWYDGIYYEGISDEFDIDVDFMKISEFEEAYAENNNLLSGYNMLILGFSDAYGNISGDAESGPVSAIMDFIESGRSVLFAHDTVSYFNYEQYLSYDKNGNGIARQGALTRGASPTLKLTDQYHNSYNLSQNIRRLVGMDRYGTTIVSELKKGVGLTPASAAWSIVENLGKEMAYLPKSGKTETTGLVQGYTYSIINAKDQNIGGGRHETFTAEETGNGSFTNTYLNLNYGTVYYHDTSADDGEIKDNYNGEISNLWVTKVNSGQITEYPYALADEFMVSNTHGQYYQLDFTADDDKDGQSDLVVWYCLGYRTNAKGNRQETIYSMSPNDVSNNYYIYNKGNITYTGVGHAGNKSTVDEAKLFINTMIASYNAGIKNPTISVLSDGTGNAEEISSFYSYYDDTSYDATEDLQFDSYETTPSGKEGWKKLYFRVSDPNFVKGERTISVRGYYESNDRSFAGDTDIVYEGKTVKVKALPMEVYDASTNKKVTDIDNLTSGKIYYILFNEDVMGKYESRFSVYFQAQSTITTKSVISGEENKVYTDQVYTRFDYTKVRLFDLE